MAEPRLYVKKAPARPSTSRSPDFCYQPLSSRFNQVQHTLETGEPTIIGVGHFLLTEVWGIFQEQLEFVLIAGWTHHAQVIEIFLIHRQDVIEGFEIRYLHPARALRAEINPTPQRRRLGTPVRLMTNVIGVRTRRIDLDYGLQAMLDHKIAKHTLSRRRTADITHTNE